MTRYLTQDEVIAALPHLTGPRLVAFIEAAVVVPVASETGPLFRDLDLARLDLLCDLADPFDLEGDTLALVIALIDQLHASRQQVRLIAAALAAEPAEVRARVAACLLASDR
ncbi:MAG: hypothetical protein Q8O82_20725 [Pseudorhodobacter sp.]|nr:hypothetical protein [Pseudorhodobacter sp.]